MAQYVSEQELRDEIIKLQNVKKLKELLSINTVARSDQDNRQIEELYKMGIEISYNKERFGAMIMLIINRVLTRPNFSGYSWKEDFISSSVEKILSYTVNNFNATGISPKSGQPFKAFAYITEIIMRACWEIINNKKAEATFINDHIIPLESLTTSISRVHKESTLTYEETHEISLNLQYDEGKLVADGIEYNSVYDCIKANKDKKLKIVYPIEYFISLDEYKQINDLNIGYLNLHKQTPEKYMPKMPKKPKAVVIDKMENWF